MVPEASESALLRLERVTRRFGGLVAVDDVSFEVRSGEIVGLIGPNGAGKTTVFNLVTGIYPPDAGAIRLYAGGSGRGWRDLVGLRPHRVAELGVARTFQTIRLFQNLTVLANVLSGQHCRTRAGLVASVLRLPSQRQEERRAVAAARRYLQAVGLWQQRHELAKNLPYGDQRRLEITRALATEPRLLVLDEPAAGLNERESAALMELIRRIRADGITILLIEHDMRVVMGISDRVAVLDNGALIADETPARVQRDTRVIEAYLGSEEDEF